MGVKVSFLGDEPQQKQTAAPRVVVPVTAVKQENGKPVVFVVKDQQVERRAVTVGAMRGSDQEIVAGVHEGEQVVVKSPDALHDGERVNVKQ